MRGRLRVVVVVLGLVIGMLPALTAPQSAGAVSGGYASGGFYEPPTWTELIATYTCTWTWTRSNGVYTDRLNCWITDTRWDGYGILARIWYKNEPSDPWTVLPFTKVDGVSVSPLVKCRLKGEAVTKQCQRSRGTRAVAPQYRFKICITLNGLCIPDTLWIEHVFGAGGRTSP